MRDTLRDREPDKAMAQALDAKLEARRAGRVYDIDRLPDLPFGAFRKMAVTRATRMDGPFVVRTREGEIVCEDGWLAIDAHGYPYPIAADEFDAIYEEVDDA